MERDNEFSELCRKNGWKCTPQRQAVYTFMKGNLRHPSVDDAWDFARGIIPTITRESVYRILNELADADVVYRMDKIGSAHYDAVMKSHGHLVCESCGNVTDFPLQALPVLPDEVPADDVRHVEVRVTWICPECRRNSAR